MRRIIIWSLTGILTIGIVVAAFYPASYIARTIETRSQGRLALLDVSGTIWHGSGVLGAAAHAEEPAAPLLPGRFSWTLSPMALLGKVKLELSNPAILDQPVTLSGSWQELQLYAGAFTLPINSLEALGAPLNTMGLRGNARLSWQTLQVLLDGKRQGVHGLAQMEVHGMTSRLAPLEILGSYHMIIDLNGKDARLELSTDKGALLLNGTGSVKNRRFHFSGKAEAAQGYEDRLSNLLHLLGQQRIEGNRSVTRLEFN